MSVHMIDCLSVRESSKRMCINLLVWVGAPVGRKVANII